MNTSTASIWNRTEKSYKSYFSKKATLLHLQKPLLSLDISQRKCNGYRLSVCLLPLLRANGSIEIIY